MRAHLTAAALLLAILPLAAHAAEPDSYVLLIGIEQYADQDDYCLSKLPYARQDLQRIQELLPYLEGFAAPQVTELWQEQAVKPAVLSALADLSAKLLAHPERSALVYFTGHGVELPDVEPLDEDDAFDEAFVLYDFPLERHPPTADVAGQYLLLDDDVAQYLSALPDCRRFIFISDSCHSGGLPKDGGANENDTKRFAWPELAERGLVTTRSELIQLQAPSELVILAAQDGESALVSNRHQSSVLTYALHRALVEDAVTCDRTADGQITLDELRFYIAQTVDEVVQAEYNMKGQQVQIATGAGSGPAAESGFVVARSSERSAVPEATSAASYWSPLAISYVAELLRAELASIDADLPQAEAQYRFSQPLRSGDGVGWSVELSAAASIAVVSFDSKGNVTLVDTADYGAGIDWSNAAAGSLELPGGTAPSTWAVRFERAGLEFAAVLLLPPGSSLRDYPKLRDALSFGYRQAVNQANKDAQADLSGTGARAASAGSWPGLLILPYEVQP